MRSKLRALRLPAAALLLLALVAGAAGMRNAFAPPTVVVTVDLRVVLDKLDQRGDAEQKLASMRQAMLEEEKERVAAMDAMGKELEGLGANDDEKRLDLSERIALARLQYQAWKAFALEQLDIEMSLLLRDLQRSVDRAVAELAELNGYDIVIMDDSGVNLSVNPEIKVTRVDQVKKQMTGRRVVYANPTVDITDELIERMNNAFGAGG